MGRDPPKPSPEARKKAPTALGDRGFMMGSTRRLGSDEFWLPRRQSPQTKHQRPREPV